jgi:hypothetical protein
MEIRNAGRHSDYSNRSVWEIVRELNNSDGGLWVNGDDFNRFRLRFLSDSTHNFFSDKTTPPAHKVQHASQSYVDCACPFVVWRRLQNMW